MNLGLDKKEVENIRVLNSIEGNVSFVSPMNGRIRIYELTEAAKNVDNKINDVMTITLLESVSSLIRELDKK